MLNTFLMWFNPDFLIGTPSSLKPYIAIIWLQVSPLEISAHVAEIYSFQTTSVNHQCQMKSTLKAQVGFAYVLTL